MKRLGFSLLITAAATLGLFHASAVGQESTHDSVMLVPLVYEDGRWSIGPEGVQVLPCAPPDTIVDTSMIDALIKAKDEAGNIVLERSVRNPRIKLIEDEKLEEGAEATGPVLMEKTSITLRLPVVQGIQVVEFFDPTKAEGFDPTDAVKSEGARLEMAPNVVVNVGDALRKFETRDMRDELPPCREFDYKPNQRP